MYKKASRITKYKEKKVKKKKKKGRLHNTVLISTEHDLKAKRSKPMWTEKEPHKLYIIHQMLSCLRSGLW